METLWNCIYSQLQWICFEPVLMTLHSSAGPHGESLKVLTPECCFEVQSTVCSCFQVETMHDERGPLYKRRWNIIQMDFLMYLLDTNWVAQSWTEALCQCLTSYVSGAPRLQSRKFGLFSQSAKSSFDSLPVFQSWPGEVEPCVMPQTQFKTNWASRRATGWTILPGIVQNFNIAIQTGDGNT